MESPSGGERRDSNEHGFFSATTARPQPSFRFPQPRSAVPHFWHANYDYRSVFDVSFPCPFYPPPTIMETLQDDPDTASEFSGFAQKFDIPTQTALIVFFVTFTVISMAVSLVIWHFHHRYAAEQRRRHDLSSSPYLESYHSKRGRERMKSKNLSCASSTKALLAEPESAQLSEKSVSDELSRGGSVSPLQRGDTQC